MDILCKRGQYLYILTRKKWESWIYLKDYFSRHFFLFKTFSSFLSSFLLFSSSLSALSPSFSLSSLTLNFSPLPLSFPLSFYRLFTSLLFLDPHFPSYSPPLTEKYKSYYNNTNSYYKYESFIKFISYLLSILN